MISARYVPTPKTTALTRLSALAELDDRATDALRLAIDRPRQYRIRRELMTEGKAVAEPLLILSGWAARVRLLEDGRRQIVHFLLPGDLLGLSDHEQPVASTTVIAMTEVVACVAPAPATSPALARAYSVGRALDEAYLYGQITRLGRLNAHERIVDLLLELFERLELAGLTTRGQFALPVTQEVLADVVGLTSVHVNRTLQALRRKGELDWRAGMVALQTPDTLRRSVGRPGTRALVAG